MPSDSEPTFVGSKSELTGSTGGETPRPAPLDAELTYVSAHAPRPESAHRPSEFPTVPGAHVGGNLVRERDADDTSPGVSMPGLLEAQAHVQEEWTQTAVVRPKFRA
jgi:hypothetical protein